MNLLDLILIGLAVGFFMLNIGQGGAREVWALLGLAAGYLLAGAYYLPLAARLEPRLPDLGTAQVTAYLGIVGAGWALGALLGALIAPLLKVSPDNALDRLAGGFVGLGKALVVSLVAVYLILYHFPSLRGLLAASWAVPYLRHLV